MLLFLCASSAVELPKQLQRRVITFFIPLLLLPPVDRLPMPLPVAFAVYACGLLMLDTVRMLLSFRHFPHAITQALWLISNAPKIRHMHRQPRRMDSGNQSGFNQDGGDFGLHKAGALSTNLRGS
jgi:hypothetical protein